MKKKMKKIMFNDRYGLTQAVLEGRKTQTRRVADHNVYNLDAMSYKIATINSSRYKVGEEVAIAQPYKDCKRFKCLKNQQAGATKCL